MQAVFARLRDIRFVRYILASVGALAVDMGCFLLLLATGTGAVAASAIGYGAGIAAHWLVSSRAGTLEEEEKLLDLAIALVRALQPEATAALADSDALARFLDATAAHL